MEHGGRSAQLSTQRSSSSTLLHTASCFYTFIEASSQSNTITERPFILQSIVLCLPVGAVIVMLLETNEMKHVTQELFH